MRTFLPYPSFVESARCLDNKRLGKQRVEAMQIILTLTKPEYGWKNHPAVKMWEGYETALKRYMDVVIFEWCCRGNENNIPYNFSLENEDDFELPPWIGNEGFHASHRSNLLRKHPEWYGRFGWTEPNNLPYVWPSSS